MITCILAFKALEYLAMSAEMSVPRFQNGFVYQVFLDNALSLSTNLRTEEQRDEDNKIFFTATSIINVALRLDENLLNGKTGGCLFVARKNTEQGVPPIGFFYGVVNNTDPEFGTKNDKYITYAFGKSMVLVQNPTFISSRQNKDLDENEQLLIGKTPVPEGGIALPNGLIIAFSGFAGHVDEAICLAIALKCGLVNDVCAQDIAELGTEKSYKLALQLIRDSISDNF